MCGFGAELRPGGRPDRAALERMGEALAPRGPDGAGLWLDGTVGLVHRRLAIIDLSERGAQPMRDDGARAHRRLQRLHLQPPRAARASWRRSATRSPRRATPRCCSRAGRSGARACSSGSPACSRSASSRSAPGGVVLARDRLGVKPLYLADLPGGGLRAASSLPALVRAGGVDTTVDPVALHHYLSWHSIVPAPRTILRGVRKLPPATVLVVEPDGSRRERRWWDPPFAREPDDHHVGSRDDWAYAVREALRVAVERRMVADVPVGILLSGGLDSSLIVALLAEQGQRGLATFSIGFPDAGGRAGDEFEFSDLVAREFGTEHRQIRVEPDAHRRGAAGRDRGDERADGLARRGRVLAALGGRRARAQGRAVRPGRRRGVRRLLLVPAAAGGAGRRARHVRGRVLRPRPRRDRGAGVARVGVGRRRVARVRGRVVRAAGRRLAGRPRPAARRRGDARRRPGQARRQHDDGPRPGGADAVPGPRARRARRRVPARAQARRAAARACSRTPRAASCRTR